MRKAVTPHELVRLGAFCSARLQALGIDISLSYDVKAVQALAEKIKKPYFTKELSHSFNDFTPNNAFWLTLNAADTGKTVGVIGARMDNLRSADVLDFMQAQATRLHSDNGGDAFDPEHYPPVIDRMSGKVVYIGDFFVIDNHRGLKNLDKRALIFYVDICVAIAWDFDWVYAFIRRPHAEQGYINTYCGVISYPEGRFWHSPPEARSDSEYFTTMDRADFAYLVKLFLKRPEAF